jgi:hypothetical protein
MPCHQTLLGNKQPTFGHGKGVKERQSVLGLEDFEAWNLALDDLQEDVIRVILCLERCVDCVPEPRLSRRLFDAESDVGNVIHAVRRVTRAKGRFVVNLKAGAPLTCPIAFALQWSF